MTQATQALLTAYEAMQKEKPDRKIGNILVEPAGDHYRVLLIDLPKKGQGKDVPSGVRIVVDRESGAVTRVEEMVLQKTPYLTSEVPSAIISGRRAFELGLAALKGYESYGKEGKLTVELVGEIYRVTFPLPTRQNSGRSADYAFQVWINALTGEVIKILVAS